VCVCVLGTYHSNPSNENVKSHNSNIHIPNQIS